jgi:hypothetical protein
MRWQLKAWSTLALQENGDREELIGWIDELVF